MVSQLCVKLILVNLGAVVPFSEDIFSASYVGIEVEIYNPDTTAWEILSPRQRQYSGYQNVHNVALLFQ